MTREEKIRELLANEELAKEIFVGDADQVLANLAAHGVELSKEELGELCEGFIEGVGAGAGDELDEEALEDVAGGFGIGDINRSVQKVIKAYKKGKSDKKNKTTKGMSYIEEAHTIEGKGWRAIGYTLGWYLN